MLLCHDTKAKMKYILIMKKNVFDEYIIAVYWQYWAAVLQFKA